MGTLPATHFPSRTIHAGRRLIKCEVRLLDALSPKPDATARRRRMRVLTRDDTPLNWWRFGRLPSELAAQLIAFKREEWQPDEVYIEGFTTFWWEGVAETVALVRKHFPHTRVILFGAYPTLAPDHATQRSGADGTGRRADRRAGRSSIGPSLYTSLPAFTYLSIGTIPFCTRSIEEFFIRVMPSRKPERVWQMAFADHDVVRRFPTQFRAVLEKCIDQNCKISFCALGNLHPRDLVDDPELASLLLRAGFRQLVFADDRHPPHRRPRETLLNDYRCAIEHCVAAGYPRRTEVLVASVCLGRPGEDPAEVVAFMTKLAHITPDRSCASRINPHLLMRSIAST